MDALISGMAWLYTHGGTDDYIQYDEFIQKALTSKIYAQCYTIAASLENVLEEQGIKIRVVTTLTLEPWNTYNNGHTMVEIFRDDYNKWAVYDLDGNASFSKDGIPLSLIEWYQLVPNDDYDIQFLANDIKVDVTNVSSIDDYDYVFLSESILTNEKQQRIWYKRVIQIPMIQDNNLDYLFFDERDPTRVEGYSKNYKFIDEKDFMNKFYE